MNLVSYEPWSVFQKMGRLYDDLNHRRFLDSRSAPRRWSPAVDVREQEGSFVIEADVPGVEAKDIEVTAEHGVLTIKAVRDSEERKAADGYTIRERVQGSFYRRFSLPDNANGGAIEAVSHDGVLVITVPKQEKAEPRRIPVA